jgi:hypothetical protein
MPIDRPVVRTTARDGSLTAGHAHRPIRWSLTSWMCAIRPTNAVREQAEKESEAFGGRTDRQMVNAPAALFG